MGTFINRATRLVEKIKALYYQNGINTFWFNAEINAGDLITPFLLKNYGFTPLLMDPKESQALVCGSLLQRVDESYRGYVLGTGFLHDGPDVNLPHAHILAVRGVLTRNRIHASMDTPLGDPGLLMCRFASKQSNPRHAAGFIPHFSDKNDPGIQQWLDRHQENVLSIDIQQHPRAVVRQMQQCNIIVSSSLHGVIFAHALNIPAVWFELPQKSGDREYKFTDYFSAFDMLAVHQVFDRSLSLSQLEKLAVKPEMDQVRLIADQLEKAFLQMRRELIR
ncbi:MAG: polysaccharide pyruvyl transferase family protein [Anaerolineae bacterium]|nr:polysaccharide pyruvyl transferase family protein [Anaerolineae bacterium]